MSKCAENIQLILNLLYVHTVGGSEEDESGEEESEFVPSYWDQSLQPSKSSLKSPEKEKEASPDVSHTIFDFKNFNGFLIFKFLNL